MNSNTKTCIIFVLSMLLVTSWATFLTIDSKSEYKPINTIDSLHTYVEPKDSTSDWERFTKALIWVESKGFSNAVGSDGDVGVLQIKKVMVDECNRIVGYKHFKYEDRLDSIKSVQMFNIVQKHHNPKRNIHLALKIWNSKADLKYHKKVEKRYNEICNNK